MQEYRLTETTEVVVRTVDRVAIPRAPVGNADWADYEAWLAAGNTPGPHVAPAPIDPADSWDIVMLKIAFNHENRVRALEAKNPITLTQFKTATKGLLQ